MDGSKLFKPQSVYAILGQGVSNLVFLSVTLSETMCIFTLGPSSSIHNSISMLFIHSAFCYDLSFPISCSKIFLPPSHPVTGISSPILPLLVGRIFFRFAKPVLSVLFDPDSVSF